MITKHKGQKLQHALLDYARIFYQLRKWIGYSWVILESSGTLEYWAFLWGKKIPENIKAKEQILDMTYFLIFLFSSSSTDVLH